MFTEAQSIRGFEELSKLIQTLDYVSDLQTVSNSPDPPRV